MTDESNSGEPGPSKKSWFARLSDFFAEGPKSREDLIEILTESHHNHLLDSHALSMMKGALKVSELQVRQVMVPRAQMVVIPKVASVNEILPIIVESGHSRFPVVGEDKDELEGILLAKDVLKSFVPGQKDFDLKSFIRPAVVIPESKQVNILLNEFRTSRNHMAIIIDEYGGVAGLVTIEDILEEIVGDIDDEYDETEDPFILKKENNKYRINALITIEEFNHFFNTELQDDEFDTLGGMLASQAGRLPENGEVIRVNKLLKFRIVKAGKRRIEFVELDLAK